MLIAITTTVPLRSSRADTELIDEAPAAIPRLEQQYHAHEPHQRKDRDRHATGIALARPQDHEPSRVSVPFRVR